MKQKKNLVLTGIIYAILFTVYNVLVFTIFKTYNNVFWLSYGFMCLAFAVQIISMLLSFKTADIETMFLGIPLASLSVYYIFAELFVSATFMFFPMAGMTIAAVVQIVLLAAFLVIAIIALMARDTVSDIGQKIKENVQNIRSILVDVEMLMGQCQDAELKASLRKVSETIKYSDPMSNASVAEVEQRIMQKTNELRVYCDARQIGDAKEACAKLDLLFMERNKKLAISK